MAKINTVLFDFDGTVMDTNQVIINSWQHTFRTLEGKERDTEEIIRTFGEPLAITMEKLLPHIPVEKGVETYRSYHYDNFSDLISVFPGITDLLKKLKQMGYKTGVVTSRMLHTTKQGLDKYDLDQYFDVVVTCDDTTKHKPDPEPIFVALEKLNSKADETIMIGDSMFDVLCAKNAGVKSVLVGWALPVSEEDKVGSNAADYIIEKADDLFQFLS